MGISVKNDIIKIPIGSQVFFSCYDDYVSHDVDYVIFESNPSLFKLFMIARGKGIDCFHYKMMSKEEFIKIELEHCNSLHMVAGKFLIPELLNYFNISLEEIKQFEYYFKNMDDKHKYEEIIYNAYITNNSFTLTDEQRLSAYMEYKKYRSTTTT